jgi:hypothetical protein
VGRLLQIHTFETGTEDLEVDAGLTLDGLVAILKAEPHFAQHFTKSSADFSQAVQDSAKQLSQVAAGALLRRVDRFFFLSNEAYDALDQIGDVLKLVEIEKVVEQLKKKNRLVARRLARILKPIESGLFLRKTNIYQLNKYIETQFTHARRTGALDEAERLVEEGEAEDENRAQLLVEEASASSQIDPIGILLLDLRGALDSPEDAPPVSPLLPNPQKFKWDFMKAVIRGKHKANLSELFTIKFKKKSVPPDYAAWEQVMNQVLLGLWLHHRSVGNVRWLSTYYSGKYSTIDYADLIGLVSADSPVAHDIGGRLNECIQALRAAHEILETYPEDQLQEMTEKALKAALRYELGQSGEIEEEDEEGDLITEDEGFDDEFMDLEDDTDEAEEEDLEF